MSPYARIPDTGDSGRQDTTRKCPATLDLAHTRLKQSMTLMHVKSFFMNDMLCGLEQQIRVRCDPEKDANLHWSVLAAAPQHPQLSGTYSLEKRLHMIMDTRKDRLQMPRSFFTAIVVPKTA